MDADIIETGLMRVPTDNVTGADYFNLVSVNADIDVDLYKMDSPTGPIRDKIEVGGQIAKLPYMQSDETSGYFLAVMKDYVPTDITDGEVWTFNARRYYRTLHLWGTGCLLNGRD